jgi:hypothetical protein
LSCLLFRLGQLEELEVDGHSLVCNDGAEKGLVEALRPDASTFVWASSLYREGIGGRVCSKFFPFLTTPPGFDSKSRSPVLTVVSRDVLQYIPTDISRQATTASLHILRNL